MANTLNISQLVARAGAAAFHARGNFFNSCDKRAAKEYFSRGVSPGMTINIPRPARFSASVGMIANPNNTVEDTVPLTVVPITASAVMTSAQKLLFMESPDDFEERIAKPLALRWCRAAEIYCIQNSMRQMSMWMGNAGTSPGTYRNFSDAQARLVDMLVPDPEGLMAALSPTTHSVLADNLKALVNPAMTISNEYLRGQVKDLAGFKAYRSQSLSSLAGITSADIGTPLVAGANQTGSTLNIDGLSANAIIPAGTKFTLSTPYALDPESKQILTWLQTFTVIGTPSTDAEGNPIWLPIVANGSGQAALPIYPPIIPLSQTNGNLQTVDVSPLDDEPVSFAGVGIKSFSTNFAYDPSAIFVASFPFQNLELKDASHVEKHEDFSIRVSILPDPKTRNEMIIMDGLIGATVVRPEWAMCLLGA